MKRSLTTAILLTAVALTGCSHPNRQPSADASPSPTQDTRIQDAASACALPLDVVRDDGRTLIFDGRGQDDAKFKDGELTYPPDKLPTSDLGCILRHLDTPDSVTEQINNTRALDGRQRSSADGLEYTWTFHPDAGIDVIITRQSQEAP